MFSILNGHSIIVQQLDKILRNLVEKRISQHTLFSFRHIEHKTILNA